MGMSWSLSFSVNVTFTKSSFSVDQRIEEHKHSAIGKHLRDAYNQRNKDLQEQFTILKKCNGKFECLIFEMLFFQEKKPELNTPTVRLNQSKTI